MQNKQKKIKIAIDGKAGTGKSTLAKALASKLNILHIDSGSMYRAAAYYFITNNIDITKVNVENNIENINIQLNYIDGMNIVLLNGENITDYIRNSEVSKGASKIAVFELVRDKLTTLQRQYGKCNSIVMDGRDIGTKVFPDSDIKIFLTTDISQRAKRRQKDLEKQNEFLSVKEIEEDLKNRDNTDMNREISPLIKADDAIEIDTSLTNVNEVVKKVIDILIDRKII